MTFLLFLCFLFVVLAAVYTVLRVRRIRAQFAPDGTFATIDGVRLHYHHCPAEPASGGRPVLVFLHGASGNAYDMKLAFQNAFRGRAETLFVDRPGLGFSERGSGAHITPAGQAALIAGLLKHLEIENALVVGHSLAGSVTAALGLHAPERVRGLAFLAPVSHVWPGGVNWYYTLAALPVLGWLFTWTLTLPVGERLAPSAMKNVFHPDLAPATYARDIRLPLLFRPESFRANAAQICSIKEAVRVMSQDYRRLNQPALIVTGTEDTVVWPSIHCEGLLSDLPAAEVLMLDRAGHMPQHTHTADIVAGLERLLSRMELHNGAADPTTEPELQFGQA